MKIKLNEQYQIRGIPMNFVLEEKKTVEKGDKAGEIYWDVVGYFPTLESLLRGLATHVLQTSETEGIELLIQDIKTFQKDVLRQIELLQDEGEGERLKCLKI